MPAPPDPTQPMFFLALADDPAVTAAYSVVPNDSPPLLPLEITSNVDWVPSLSGVPLARTATLSVAGDPTGAVTAHAHRGVAYAELTWTPGAAREFGRSYVAHLADGGAETQERWPVYYQPSTFEFSYFDGSSAEFLPQIDLTLSDVQEHYGSAAPSCCEVERALCAGASSCFQCWDQVGRLSMHPVWTGPGLPYLSLETDPQGTFEVTEFGEYCVQGTASTASETRSFSVCHTVTDWPLVEIEGHQTVFADSCQAMPEGYFPLTRLFVVRAETEAAAQRHFSSARTTGQPHHSDPVSRCGLSSRPVEGHGLVWLGVLAMLG
ncbi:MAG TPA: hypothetical protein VI197_25270, partial [Polyangiaceae bacterium]